jgi:protein-tyrosine-phosphatase
MKSFNILFLCTESSAISILAEALIATMSEGEASPIWPGHPASIHCELPDPALAKGSYEGQRKVFLWRARSSKRKNQTLN